MSFHVAHGRDAPLRRAQALLTAAHIGPGLAVTLLAALLCAAQGLGPARGGVVVAAVLAGQLSVGWSNDLVDVARDQRAGRRDKPLVSGATSVGVVRLACAGAIVACVALSLAAGITAGLVHLGCVALAWSYNLGLKTTVWSWLPYAASFAGLTAFVTLADGQAPPWWWPVGAALLGVGAHLLNVLPDLADDAATGVNGLPHRLGPRRITPTAAAVLLAASVVVIVGSAAPPAVSVPATTVVLGLTFLVLTGAGRVPFLAAIAVAAVDTVLLVAAR